MEGRIKKYLQVDEFIATPYTNHVGRGHQIGSGDKFGKGSGASYVPRKNDYNGSDILSFNNHQVYIIDGYLLYITHIRQPWALAKIIKNDLTTQDCYVGKINNNVVVAKTIREALELLRQKIGKSDDNNYDIAQAFVYAHPEYEKEYDWDEMVMWHSLDRTSCLDGRRRFSMHANKEAGSTATPKELIHIMKQSKAAGIAIIMEQLYLSKK